MSDDVANIIKAHVEQLENQLGVLHEQIIPIVREISRSRRALEVLGVTLSSDTLSQMFLDMKPPTQTDQKQYDSLFVYQRMTIGQLAVEALKKEFINGATGKELLKYFKENFDRTDVIRASLSPQLSRLKRAGKLSLDGEVWTSIS